MINILMVVFIAVIGFYHNFMNEHEFIKSKLLEEKILTAKIVGSYAASDIGFDNKKSAIVSLSYLESDESTINVHLYDEDGNYFISLYENKEIPDVGVVSAEKSIFKKNELQVIEPIKVGGELFGYILLQSSTRSYADDYKRNINQIISMFLVLVLIVIAIAGPLASIVTSPISELVKATKKVTRDNDYITRVEVKNKDEVGELVNAFNEMLLQIKIRDGERDQSDQLLRDSEEFLSLTLNNMIIGVITVSYDWKVKSYNRSAQKMFGYKESEVVGSLVLSLFADGQKIRLQKEIDFHHDSGHLGVLSGGLEMKGLKKDQTEFPVYMSVTSMRDPKTEETIFIVSIEDITNKKIQDEQLRRTQRMDALGNLTGGVAHDYNNMLGVILGYAELLSMNTGLPDKVKSYIKEIAHAANRASKLTKKLLAFTKRTSAESLAVNVNEVLINNKSMIEKTLTLKIKLEYFLDDNLWHVWLDAGDLEDAVVNLSINAMHAMEQGGSLTFTSQNLSLSEIESRALQLPAGEYVLLKVADTGQGMNEATRIRIFEPFFSTKADKGTGLGLSQVYGFVKRSNGEIKVYSEPGKGTHFDFYFPRYHAEHNNSGAILEEENIEQYSGTETILVVDDEPGLRKLADELLSYYGYSVTCVDCAESALEILTEERFDMLLSDVIMTGMDGYELADKVREKYPLMKVQLASGFSYNKSHTDSVDDLQNTMLQKPYRKIELLRRVRTLFDEG